MHAAGQFVLAIKARRIRNGCFKRKKAFASSTRETRGVAYCQGPRQHKFQRATSALLSAVLFMQMTERSSTGHLYGIRNFVQTLSNKIEIEISKRQSFIGYNSKQVHQLIPIRRRTNLHKNTHSTVIYIFFEFITPKCNFIFIFHQRLLQQEEASFNNRSITLFETERAHRRTQ